MDAQNKVEITDRDGWRKEFLLQKPLIHIGSDPRNDIVLEAARGTGVSSRHLQLICVPGEQPGYRGINLGDGDIVMGDLGNVSVGPRSAAQIADGDRLKLGDFFLVFHLGGEGGAALPAASTRAAGTGVQREERLPVAGNRKASAVIGVSLALSGSALAPDHPLDSHSLDRRVGRVAPGAVDYRGEGGAHLIRRS